MQPPTSQQAYDAEIKTRLQAQSIAPADLPEHFYDWCAEALRHESRATLGCDLETIKRLHGYCEYEIRTPVTLFDAGFLINAIERRTPDEWNSSDYPEAQEAQEKLAAKWNELVTPIKQAILRKLETQHNISRGVPQGKQIIGKA